MDHALKHLINTAAQPFWVGIVALIMLSSGCRSWAQSQSKPGEGVTLEPAVSTYLESVFLSEVSIWGLKELGYTVTSGKQLDPALRLQAVADGDLDFTAEYIERGQRPMFDAAGGDAKLQMVGTIMPRYLESYFIDKATADKHSITTLDQLKDPELAKLFDSDGDGKANLIGCPAGWSCQERIEHQLETYGLDDTIEQVSGNYSVLMADTVARYQQDQPVLYFSYVPYWIAAILQEGEDVEVLEVPFTSLPGDQTGLTDADTTYDGKNYGFVADRYRSVVGSGFAEEYPAAMQWLELVQVPTEDVSEISRRINDGEDDPEDVRKMAEEWVEANRDQVDQWLAEARAATP